MSLDTAEKARDTESFSRFGIMLAVLVLIDVLVWLWSLTLGSNMGVWLLAYLGGLGLIVVWLGYLLWWAIRIRRFSWQLAVIPAIGALGLVAAFTGVPQQLRWAYDEPRLTEAAEQVRADPRPEFYDSGNRSIGTQEVYATSKQNGVVTFSVRGGGLSITEIQFRPDGIDPEPGYEARTRRLSDQWQLVYVD